MILYNVLSELDGILAESGALIDMYKAKELVFFDRVQRWLERLEKMAADNRWSFQSSIAALRGQLVTVSRKQKDDSFPWMPHSKNSRRAREALAAETLRQAIELVGNFVAADREQQAKAAELLRQVLAMAIFKGIVSLKPTNGNSHYISQSWNAVASDQDFAPTCVHVVGLVGAYNAYILFDKSFNEVLINGYPSKDQVG